MSITTGVGRKLPPAPPSAFKWYSYVKGGTGGMITLTTPANTRLAIEQLPALVKWAIKHDYGLTPYKTSYTSTMGYDVDVWTTFKVNKSVADTHKYFGTGEFVAKDGKTYPVGTGAVEGGGNLACTSCYRIGTILSPVRRAEGQTTYLCPLCAVPCSTKDCENYVYKNERKGLDVPQDKCADCSPMFKCGGCAHWQAKENSSGREVSTPGTARKYELCKGCAERQICQKCSVWQKTPALMNCGGVMMCQQCSHEYADRARVEHEKFTEDELPRHGTMVIPSLPARPIRTVSIETEVDGDKHYFSKTMYSCGLVRVPVVEAYGTGVPEMSPWAAFLKHDGSVTGGELITYLLSLDNKEHAGAFLDVLSKVRSLAKIGKLEFNPNCGGHIHIDAHNFDDANIWKLLTVWNYVEDITYRLAGAGHKYGHRTQVAGHDRANHGGGYAEGVVKGPWGVKSGAGRAAQTQNRMCGLNFQPYFYALRNCVCGAVGRGYTRECTCNLGKCTIEWRVWNSQANPRILHAWIAYMQAMHAFADGGDEPTKAFEDKLPALAWKKKPWISTTIHEQSAVKIRLEWIFANLVFTEDERDSLIYTIKQSDMIGLGVDYIDSLAAIKGPDGEKSPITKPRNPTTRQARIVIKKPTAGKDPLSNLTPGDRERLQYHLRRR